jgi:chorismate synthase
MQIESDTPEFLSGVRFGKTLGSPIAVSIENKDFQSWQDVMAPFGEQTSKRAVTRPRPGHADLAGGLKYNTHELRDILERASARETAARVVVGALCKLLLQTLGVRVLGHVLSIGKAKAPSKQSLGEADRQRALASEVACIDPNAEADMIKAIEQAKKDGDTLGGVAEVRVLGLVPGLGSHVQWDLKLDGRLAQALMSIPAIKAVAIGEGFEAAEQKGSEVHDAIFFDEKRGFYRKTNRSGGLEGDMTTGEELVVRAFMKPIATLMNPLPSVDVRTKQPEPAEIERSDTCAVPAMCVVAEAMVAFVLADAYLQKLGGDTLGELLERLDRYKDRLEEY